MHHHYTFNYLVCLCGESVVYMVHVWRLEDKLWGLFLSTVRVPGMLDLVLRSIPTDLFCWSPRLFLKSQSIAAELLFPPNTSIIKSVPC